jgi:hypothetical protein
VFEVHFSNFSTPKHGVGDFFFLLAQKRQTQTVFCFYTNATIDTQRQCRNPLCTNLLYKHIVKIESRCAIFLIAMASVFAMTARSSSL